MGNLRNLYISTLEQISRKSYEEDIDMNDYTYSDDIQDEVISPKVFHATRYKSIMYVKPECDDEVKELIEKAGFEYNLFKGTQRNLSKFMRHLLVRRFESSTAAFKFSLESMITSSNGILKWIEKRGKVPVYKKGYLPDVDELYQTDDDNIDNETREQGVELELD